MTMERAGAVLFGGQPCTLVGPEMKVGDTAPDVQLVDHTLAPKKLSDVSAKVKIISCVVSLDTGVCSDETKRFEKELEALGNDVALITVSRDLPFAQGRFCDLRGADAPRGATAPEGGERGNPAPNNIFLSDYASGAFGHAYGTWIKEVSLNCRAVFVVDASNKLVYVHYVHNTPTQPDYEPILAAVKQALAA